MECCDSSLQFSARTLLSLCLWILSTLQSADPTSSNSIGNSHHIAFASRASSPRLRRIACHLRPQRRFMAASGGSSATAEAMAGSQDKPPAGVADRIMPHLLNMYGSCATARDFEIYAANATYEDPLLRAHGVKQIKSAFYTLPKVFGESKITEYTIQENPMGPGKTEIVIDNKQYYKIVGKPVDLTSLIWLLVEDGKVVKHEDWWNKKPLKNKATVGLPLMGRLAEASRRGAMLLTHAIMGFGNDPKPAAQTPPPSQ